MYIVHRYIASQIVHVYTYSITLWITTKTHHIHSLTTCMSTNHFSFLQTGQPCSKISHNHVVWYLASYLYVLQNSYLIAMQLLWHKLNIQLTCQGLLILSYCLSFSYNQLAAICNYRQLSKNPSGQHTNLSYFQKFIVPQFGTLL